VSGTVVGLPTGWCRIPDPVRRTAALCRIPCEAVARGI
jgi:hypothetical protein